MICPLGDGMAGRTERERDAGQAYTDGGLGVEEGCSKDEQALERCQQCVSQKLSKKICCFYLFGFFLEAPPSAHSSTLKKEEHKKEKVKRKQYKPHMNSPLFKA